MMKSENKFTKSEISEDVSFLSCFMTLYDRAWGVTEYTCDGIAQSGTFEMAETANFIDLQKQNKKTVVHRK